MKNFQSGVVDYLKLEISVVVNFPINNNGEPVIACKFCKCFTGNRCVVTNEIIYQPEKFVGFDCPLKKENENGI